MIFDTQDMELLHTNCFPELKMLEKDGLIILDECEMSVTDIGRHFIRNICKAFDLYLMSDNAVCEKPVFSKSI